MVARKPISEVIFKDPPKIPFKTSIKIASRGYFYFLKLFFASRSHFQKNSLKRFLGNWEGGGEGAVERGGKSNLKKPHKPWTRGKKGAPTPWIREGLVTVKRKPRIWHFSPPKCFSSQFALHGLRALENLPGNFALRNAGDFWWIFAGLDFPRKEARELLKKFGKNWEQTSGQKSGRKIREENSKNSGNFRAATFLT